MPYAVNERSRVAIAPQKRNEEENARSYSVLETPKRGNLLVVHTLCTLSPSELGKMGLKRAMRCISDGGQYQHSPHMVHVRKRSS